MIVLLSSLAASAPPGDEMPDDIRKRVEEATVFIEVKYRPLGRDTKEMRAEDYLRASGSGVIISADGLILTNAHVVWPVHVHEPQLAENVPPVFMARERRTYVRDSVEVWIHCGTPRAKRLIASVLCTRDNPRDLALLRIDHRLALRLAFLTPADALGDPAQRPSLKNGQRLWAVGFPLGRSVDEAFQAFKFEANPNGPDIAIRPGFVSSLRHGEGRRLKLIEHSCGIEPGNSGGPLVNAAGQLVGLNTWGYESSKKFDYAIPLATILNEFDHTLRQAGGLSVNAAPARRVLVVEPSDEKDGDLRFRTLAAAVAAARDGDVIDLNQGEHQVEQKVTVNKALWIRGAGRDKTRLAGEPIIVESPEYVEISDLRLETLIMDSRVGNQAFLHGLGFNHLNATGAGNLVDSEGEIVWSRDKDQGRVECVTTFVQGVGGHVTILGCDLREGRNSMLMFPGFFNCEVAMTGSRVHQSIAIKGARGLFRNNLFSNSTFTIDEKSTTRFEQNRFEGASVIAGSDATFRSNYFVADRFTSLGTTRGRLMVQDNVFYFPGRSYVRKNEDGMPQKPPERFTYGMAAVDKGASIEFSGNRFISRKAWGDAYGQFQGGELIQGRDNSESVSSPTHGAGRADEE